MSSKPFEPPRFSAEQFLEFRIDGKEVAIYATQHGLKWLAAHCLQLAEDERTDWTNHIHLEDFGILTAESSPAVIGVFRAIK